MPLRSLLFVPGNQPRKLERAFDFNADVVMYDLEDAVPADEKDAARLLVAEAVSSSKAAKERTGSQVAVRINGWGSGELLADLESCVHPGLDLVKATKIESAADLVRLDGALAVLERQRGLVPGSVAILPEIDSARGVLDLPALASSTRRVRSVNVSGGQDFANDLHVEVSDDMVEAQWATGYAVLVSRSLGLEAPVHGSIGLHDAPRRERILRRAHAIGYQGASCIHPSQVEPTNEIFTPSIAQLERARRIVGAFLDAEREGMGTAVTEGEFVDEAHYRGAVAVLARAGIQAEDGSAAMREEGGGS